VKSIRLPSAFFGKKFLTTGRYVLSPYGSKLVDGDTNAIMDVFRRDRIAGKRFAWSN
jgi:hypothetical protein